MTPHDRPRLPRGVRLQHDPVRDTPVLLGPEVALMLDPIGQAVLAELDIDCQFEQNAGERNNAGHYQIRDWGPIDPRWIAANLQQIKTTLGYP